MIKYIETNRVNMIEIAVDGPDEELIEINKWLSIENIADRTDGVEWALELWKQNERLTVFFFIDEIDVKEFYMAFKLRWL